MRLCRLCKRLYPDDQARCVDHAGSVSDGLSEVCVEPLPAAIAARFPQHQAFAQGATGTLYRLADEPSSVLKVLHASLTRDATERARYRRELRRQQSLIQPQLPRIQQVEETEERIWFTRDFVEGESLAARLQHGEGFELAAAYSVIIQLSAALDALHQLGLVHRDVKPGHVLLRANRAPRESVQLVDAAVVGPLTSDDASRQGTPDYAAKELIEGAPATFRSDLYALGCLSYELLAGAPPFRDATRNASGTDAASTLATLLAVHRDTEPNELPGHVPQAVRSLITSLLAKDAHRRPFSAQQVRRALEPHVAAANAAARRASLSGAPLQAAALRSSGPAAKPHSPATFPDATVELDVEDLDEAIQVNDEPGNGDGNRVARGTAAVSSQSGKVAPEPAVSTSPAAAHVDDSAPTIALNTLSTRAIMSSMLPNATGATGATSASAATSAPNASHAEGASKSPPTAAAAADTAAAAESAPRAPTAPTHAPTGTKFGLGPVRAEDIRAATALAAELKSSPLTAADQSSAEPATSVPSAAASAGSPRPAAGPSQRKRYTSVQHPLMQSPQLLLVAAAGLIALIVVLRVVLGPSETTRSAAVVVQVPEAASDSLDRLEEHAQQQLDQLSEEALIGGNIPRKAQLTAAQRRHAARARHTDQADQAEADQVAQGDLSPPSAAESKPQPTAAERPADKSGSARVQPQSIAAVTAAKPKGDARAGDRADDHADDQTEEKNVPTVSAGSVRGGLARAASTRQATTSGNSGNTNVSAVNADNSPDTDFKARGRELFKAGKYTEAVEAYQRATKRDSADAAAFAGLGGSLLAKGETRRAITAYQRAVHLQPEVSGFQAALGRAYLQKGDRTRARSAYSKALALDPNNQAARTGMANAKTR